MITSLLSGLLTFIWIGFTPAGSPPLPVKETALWTSGSGTYHTYRIPALVTTTKGTLLAFCEGRKNASHDAGDIDLLLRRSADNGRTWTSSQVVWDDGTNTCGNPGPIVDHQTGVIWLLMTWNHGSDKEPAIIGQTSKDTRRIYVTSSEDEGRTWKHPIEITSQVKKADWTWYATGPGSGIQVSQGSHKGRLLLGCDHIEAGTQHYYSHVIYSDDHGANWQLGGSTSRHQVNECEVAELGDGRLVLNMRNYDTSQRSRQITFSSDGGLSWHDQHFSQDLTEPICQASLLTVNYSSTPLLIFANPASLKRENMSLKLSADYGRSWTTTLVLHPGPSAYSDLSLSADKRLLCVYEQGQKHPYEKIVLASVPLKKLITAFRNIRIGEKAKKWHF